ncbi:MAG: hypothetical protein L0J17_07010 [Brevibacterium sp.]|uniref:hypothetical protein n=1 Tax=Brevibacterium sp. TaxID=1701 RepID=UPI002647EDB9|nr:hypothetical protein [Brevibacterium sp.]MDN5806933.1 hypothetical protein [Brevibacterium sp.]MDN5833269.1 hypothetical protein [Brevibacterium sp.]MDN5877657.1 hypothetical protein [Brevibacterium sp.]MDN5910507.1 hypothetical protein [Brevibacterium sp.]MDN6133166.1 hypothetical protein [Brevibacterium sp.]
MKLIRRALVSGLAALALVVVPAVSAQAANISFDVTKLSASSVVVANTEPIKIYVNMSYKIKRSDGWMVDTNIYGRHGKAAEASFYSTFSPDNKDRVTLSPDESGLGKYTLGPSEVETDYDNGYKTVWDDFTDYTKGSFYVRGKTYASLSTKRSGKTVTLTSKTKVYNPEKYGKVNYSPKVKFQVKSGSKWKTIKTVTAKKGKATYKVKTKSKKTYRVTFSQASWATGATSKSVKR